MLGAGKKVKKVKKATGTKVMVPFLTVLGTG